MSRTDKTKPWRVRVAEHNPKEVHDHSRGVCDLPATPLSPDPVGAYRWTHCHWDLWLDSNHCCAGSQWSGQAAERRIETRIKRAKAKEDLRRELVQEPVTGKPRPKKDLTKWCGGKPGRPHRAEIRWANWAGWRLERGIACHYVRWMTDKWSCYHEIGCTKCGKILKFTAGVERCPLYPR